MNKPESVYKDNPCQIEHKCPWGVRPVVGMWKQFDDGSQLFATDCLSRFKGCPRHSWTEAQWKGNRAPMPQPIPESVDECEFGYDEYQWRLKQAGL